MPTTKRDYYEILGIAKTATEDEIKRAYRGLALKCHPDRVPAEQKKEAEEKFKELSEAYAVLSDKQKRSVYDQYGHGGFDQRYSTEDIFRNADFSSIFEDMGFGGSIFEQLFGGAFGGSTGGGGRRGTRGADLEMELPLAFEEAARGIEKTVTVPRRELCDTCRGEGGDHIACVQCAGSGQIRQSAGFMVLARPCPRCGGQGSILKKACAKCKGQGRIAQERKLQVTVPPGVESGMRLRLAGEGEAGTRGRGDLYVHLTVRPHPLFQREGPHLIVELPIDIAQASLGAELNVPTLHGHVAMKVPPGTQSGTVFRVRGKGLPDVHGRGQGDLMVRAVVETPTQLSGAHKKALEEFRRSVGDDAHPARRAFFAKVHELWKKR